MNEKMNLEEIRSEIKDYLRQHAQELRKDSQITADHTKTANQDYSVHCRAQENGATLIDLQLTVPTESAARTIEENWKTRSPEVYAMLMKQLLS